jgi:hypothetical protein
MDALDEISSRYFELTRESYKRLGSDSSKLEVSMADANDQLQSEVVADHGIETWARWTDRHARSQQSSPRGSRSQRIKKAERERQHAETDALIADTRAFLADSA